MALSEETRERATPGEMVDFVLALMRDKSVHPSIRLQAWRELADRGWTKPPAQVEVAATVTPTLPAGWGTMPVMDRAAWLEAMRSRVIELPDESQVPEDE